MPNPRPIADQYRAALSTGGIVMRDDRALISVTGNDRAVWLHNLVTNTVKTLQPGDGNYAFAANIKGRVVFDANMLVLDDRIWLDLDRRWMPAAMEHLDRYVITEDVKLDDITSQSRRIAVLGPAAVTMVHQLGLGNLVPMPQLQNIAARIADTDARLIRNDFTGLPTAEFIAIGPQSDAVIIAIQSLAVEHELFAISPDTLNVLRIEAGIPASLDDIDEEVVPPETMQIERGISYHKGCYLGQEVIERMRSHNILARRLVGAKIDGDTVPSRNTTIKVAEQDVGRITSGCWSEALGCVLCLGYVKSAHAKPGVTITVDVADAPTNGEVVALPVRASR